MCWYKTTRQTAVLEIAKLAFSKMRSGKVTASFEQHYYSVKNYVRDCYAS